MLGLAPVFVTAGPQDRPSEWSLVRWIDNASGPQVAKSTNATANFRWSSSHGGQSSWFIEVPWPFTVREWRNAPKTCSFGSRFSQMIIVLSSFIFNATFVHSWSHCACTMTKTTSCRVASAYKWSETKNKQKKGNKFMKLLMTSRDMNGNDCHVVTQ